MKLCQEYGACICSRQTVSVIVSISSHGRSLDEHVLLQHFRLVSVSPEEERSDESESLSHFFLILPAFISHSPSYAHDRRFYEAVAVYARILDPSAHYRLLAKIRAEVFNAVIDGDYKRTAALLATVFDERGGRVRSYFFVENNPSILLRPIVVAR